MDWAYRLAYVTGMVNEELMLRNEYLAIENRNSRQTGCYGLTRAVQCKVQHKLQLEFMKTLSMVELRNKAEKVIRQVGQGQRFLLTYRGKPVARLEPILPQRTVSDDRFYHLYELADEHENPITNDDIDRILYGK